MNFGILPLEFENPNDYEIIEQGVVVTFKNLKRDIAERHPIKITVSNKNDEVEILLRHSLSNRQIELLMKGRVIKDFKERLTS